MERKTIELLKKADCTGCMACLLQCPKHCISKQKNEEGFWYPVIKHDQCVNCGACYQVCPQLNPPQVESIKYGCIGIKKEEYTKKASVKDCIKQFVKHLIPVKARENIRRLIFKYGFAK